MSVSVALFLSIGEFVVWMLEPESDPSFFVSSDTGPRTRLIPNWQGVYCGRKVTINASGYRGAEVPLSRTNVPRIAVYGDSHTFGIGAGDGDSYPAVMSRLLEMDLESPVEVLNLGLPGSEVSDAAAHFEQTFPIYKPDLVILTYNYGDVKSSELVLERDGGIRVGLADTGTETEEWTGEHTWRNDARNLKAFLYSRSMLMRFLIPQVDSALRPHVIPFLDPKNEPELREIADDGPRWRSARHHIEMMRNTARKAGASMLVVMYPPSLCNFLCYKDLFAMVQTQVEEMGIAVVNPLGRFAGAKSSDFQATLLDNHPNEASYRIVAEEVEIYVAKVMRSRDLGGEGKRRFGSP